MPRPRRYTETLGCLLTMKEREIMQAYLKSRRMTASEYLRETAIRPVVEAVLAGGVQKDEANE